MSCLINRDCDVTGNVTVMAKANKFNGLFMMGIPTGGVLLYRGSFSVWEQFLGNKSIDLELS